MVAPEELETISVKKAMFEKELRNAEVVLKKNTSNFPVKNLLQCLRPISPLLFKKDNTSEIPDLNVSALVAPEDLKPFKCAFCDERFLTQKS